MKLLGQMQAGFEGDGPEAQLHMAAGVWGIAGFEQVLGVIPSCWSRGMLQPLPPLAPLQRSLQAEAHLPRLRPLLQGRAPQA